MVRRNTKREVKRRIFFLLVFGQGNLRPQTHEPPTQLMRSARRDGHPPRSPFSRAIFARAGGKLGGRSTASFPAGHELAGRNSPRSKGKLSTIAPFFRNERVFHNRVMKVFHTRESFPQAPGRSRLRRRLGVFDAARAHHLSPDRGRSRSRRLRRLRWGWQGMRSGIRGRKTSVRRLPDAA